MKLPTIGFFAASAAALLLGACAAEHHGPYAEGRVYRSGVVGTEPVFVERQTVYIDRTPRVVPVYRTGDSYFYTYSGRRYSISDYPRFRRTTYRTSSDNPQMVRDGDQVVIGAASTRESDTIVRRTVVRDDPLVRRTVVRTGSPEIVAEDTRGIRTVRRTRVIDRDDLDEIDD